MDQQTDGRDVIAERFAEEVHPRLFQDGHHRGVIDVLVGINI